MSPPARASRSGCRRSRETADGVGTSIAALRSAATSAGARSAIDDATATLADFAEVDTRARDYLRLGQLLMAGDVIFTEGDQTAATAARQVEAARLAEHQALDASEGVVRRQEAMALAGAGGLTAAHRADARRRRRLDKRRRRAALDHVAAPIALDALQ